MNINHKNNLKTMKDIFCTRDNISLYAHIKSRLLYGDIDKCKNPTVSILMPVYCHPNYFYQALQSAINQDYSSEYEIVVVDNNDLDNEANKYRQIVCDFAAPNVFYYRNEKNMGMFGNWNRCIELARAPYVTFCHDDDMLLPTALNRLMFLQKTTKNMAIFSDRNIIDRDGNYICILPQNKWKGLLKLKEYCELTLFDLFVRCFSTGVGSLYAKRFLIEMGGYDDEFYPCSDYVLDIIYTYRYGAVRSSIPVCNGRESGENTGNSVYFLLADMCRQFRYYVRNRLPHPKWMLDIINTAIYNVSKGEISVSYEHKDKSAYPKVRFRDKFITKLLYVLLSLKRYKL
jgi:glycosyltransferase involved in cell wall biosynthesis